MEEESCAIHSEDDNALPDKNKKRIVKTRAQVEALEKFYDEHKYPSEPMKIQIAESIGLTDKQVSGWFCHRRLKDKKLQNGEACLIERKDLSSGVIQDRGSGLRQDSCGSTKQGDDRNFDTKEVESGRLNLQELSTADLTNQHGRQYKGNNNRMDDEASGSSSSLRNMSFHPDGDPFAVATSTYLIPKFPVEEKGIKARSGPSGYLKVKGKAENSAVTAVKRKLGGHYREDGPPLVVDFDPLPPGAFESSMQNPVDEPYYTGEADLPISPNVSKIRRYPRIFKSSQEREYNSAITSYNSSIEGAKMIHKSDAPVNHIHHKFAQKMTSPDNVACYTGRSFSVEIPESSGEDTLVCESRDNYLMKFREGVEGVRMGSFPNRLQLQFYGGHVEKERTKLWAHNAGPNVSHRDDIEKKSSYMAIKRNEYHNFEDKALPQKIVKDGRFYRERRILNENCESDQVRVPMKNEMPAPNSREFHQQQYNQRTTVVENTPWTSQAMRSRAEMPSSSREEEESAETSSSVD